MPSAIGDLLEGLSKLKIMIPFDEVNLSTPAPRFAKGLKEGREPFSENLLWKRVKISMSTKVNMLITEKLL
jgi:hypothetical protein